MVGVLLLALQTPPKVAPSGGLGVGLEIVGAVVVGCAILTATILLLGRHARSRVVDEEAVARGAMDELCPHGWRAQITVYATGGPLPEDAPPAEGPLVSVDWAEYARAADGGLRVAVMRRAWGHSISGALRQMVADRRLDRTLEEIERRVPAPPGEG
jgi:hypothetical protein